MSAALNNWWQITGLFALEILILVLAATLLQRLHRSPHWTRAVWHCALLCLIVLTLCEGFGLASRVARLIPVRPVRFSQATPPLATPTFAIPTPLVLPEITELPAVDTAATTIIPNHDRPQPRAVSTKWPTHRVAAAIWIAGTLFLLSYILLARVWLAIRLARLPQNPQLLDEVQQLLPLLRSRRRVRLVSSEKFLSPIAFGLFRPVIVLPHDFKSAYTPAQQRVILLHELAHVVGHDQFWHFIADLLGSLLWWHPAVWWARRRSLIASEMAADDIVRLLPEGAATLAESLVKLGSRYRTSWPQVAAQGAAFRSGLGRRVERLIDSPSPAHPRPLLTRLILSIGPLCLVAGVVFGSAWARPHSPQPPETMKKTSATSAGLLMAITLAHAQEVTPATGSPAVLPSGPNPQPAIVQRASAPPPRIGAQQIQRKLERVILESVEYDSLPLSEVVKDLIQESARRDDDNQGINFVFQTFRPPTASPIDPATGLPLPQSGEEVELASITVRIAPPLKQVRLIDVLDAITRVADRPISYSINDYAVVLSLRKPLLDPSALSVQTFSIDAMQFVDGIEQAFGVEVRSAPISQTDLKRVLNRLGVDTDDAGKAAFYNAQTGVLMVRLTHDELAIVEAAVRTLGGSLLSATPGRSKTRGQAGDAFGGGGFSGVGSSSGSSEGSASGKPNRSF